MGEMTSMEDIIRHMALADPKRAFDAICDTYNLRPSRAHFEPAMLDHDGDEVQATEARSAMFNGGPVTIAEYPQGITTVAVGSEHMTMVHRQWRGKEHRETWYVFDERLERYRATGIFGEIEDMDPYRFLVLLREHRILEELGIDQKHTYDSDYVAFLREHGASENVIDG